jgi:cell wall-associated NlpC family hydrolase
MATYRYRPPRYYARYYGRGSLPTPAKAGLAVAAAVVLAGAGHAAAHAGAHNRGTPARAAGPAVQAISYARHRLGLPYCWGGTGPSCYDCSGLTSQAYGLPSSDRTSEDQWANLPHVASPQRGDLVFFAGSDGTATSPGHVALVLNPARHTMIEAYATGFPIRISTYGLPSSAPGDTDPVGFARPGGAS